MRIWPASLLAIAVAAAAEPVLILDIATSAGNGIVEINLREDLAPNHVERIVTLTNEGAYDGVAFHRVIEGFMAQTGDVEFGKIEGDLSDAGRGASQLPDIKAEFSEQPFDLGVVGMARSAHPDSANSQFFIMLAPGHFLNGQYSVIGEVISGQDVVDRIKKGDPASNGTVSEPDYVRNATIQNRAK